MMTPLVEMDGDEMTRILENDQIELLSEFQMKKKAASARSRLRRWMVVFTLFSKAEC